MEQGRESSFPLGRQSQPQFPSVAKELTPALPQDQFSELEAAGEKLVFENNSKNSLSFINKYHILSCV